MATLIMSQQKVFDIGGEIYTTIHHAVMTWKTFKLTRGIMDIQILDCVVFWGKILKLSNF